MNLIITILPVVTKDLPISPRFTPNNFLSRCKFSTITTRQPMVDYKYVCTVRGGVEAVGAPPVYFDALDHSHGADPPLVSAASPTFPLSPRDKNKPVSHSSLSLFRCCTRTRIFVRRRETSKQRKEDTIRKRKPLRSRYMS